MRKKINIIGKRFGRLVVIKENGKNKYKAILYLCQCDCGNKKITLGNSLRSGGVESCGCIRKDFPLNYKHGLKGTKFYKKWESMKERCNNPNCKNYPNYGGRGIKVSNEWLDFNNFKKDMYDDYLKHVEIHGERNTTIERENNNLGYSKENCSWKTMKEQANNRRTNHLITYKRKTLTIAQWEKETGIKQSVICKRLKMGWTIKNALTIPLRKKYVK